MSSIPDRHVSFRLGEHAEYQVAVVLLITCRHRDGRGHRFTVNPTGASLLITTTDAGVNCLADHGVVQATRVR